MEDMRVRLKNAVAQRLTDAPDSVAKGELIEELAENLYCRYADLVEAGMESEAAMEAALDALGETGELVEYLKSIEPDQPLPQQVEDPDGEDIRRLEGLLSNVEEIIRGAVNKARSVWEETRDTVVEAGVFEHRQDEKDPVDADFESVEAEREVYAAELERKMAEAERQMEQRADALAAKEEELAAAQEVLSQLEDARNALENVDDQSILECALAEIAVKIGAQEAEIRRMEEEQTALEEERDAFEEEMNDLEAELDAIEDGRRENGCRATRHIHVELDSAALKDSVKGAVKDIEAALRDAAVFAKDAVRKAREEAVRACAPEESVAADEPICAEQITGIDVHTAGDITVRMTQAPDGDVLVGGDIEKLEVFRSSDGVLTVRAVKTETSSFFSRRGIFSSRSAADVVLDLPCRPWKMMKLTSGGGDVELRGDMSVEQVSVSGVSGDICVSIPSCTRASCRTTSGQVNWKGDVTDLDLESVSGDMEWRGRGRSVTGKSTSGDITAEGSFLKAGVRTVSGDMCLRSDAMPDGINVSTVSGDTWVDIPDGGPFAAGFHTTSGDFTSDFFTGSMSGRNCTFTYQGGGERRYNFTGVSGDVEIRKYRG